MPAQLATRHTKARAVVHPWVRLFARLFDYLLVLAFLVVLLDQFLPVWRGTYWLNLLWLTPLSTLIWVPIESFALHHWDTTPGKSLLRVSVIHEEQHHLRLPAALHRSLEVWLRGMGCGVPLVSQLLWLISYHHVTHYGSTVWDEDCHSLVKHKPIQNGRIALYVILALLIDIFTLGLIGEFSRLFLYVDVRLPF